MRRGTVAALVIVAAAAGAPASVVWAKGGAGTDNRGRSDGSEVVADAFAGSAADASAVPTASEPAPAPPTGDTSASTTAPTSAPTSTGPPPTVPPAPAGQDAVVPTVAPSSVEPAADAVGVGAGGGPATSTSAPTAPSGGVVAPPATTVPSAPGASPPTPPSTVPPTPALPSPPAAVPLDGDSIRQFLAAAEPSLAPVLVSVELFGRMTVIITALTDRKSEALAICERASAFVYGRSGTEGFNILVRTDEHTVLYAYRLTAAGSSTAT